MKVIGEWGSMPPWEPHHPSEHKKGKHKVSMAPPCYTTHKPVKFPGCPGVVYGGSCGTPGIEDADVYVGLDWSMRRDRRMFPWNTEGVAFQFLIQDQHAPSDAAEFRKMIDWLAVQLSAGKKVHIGCIGGHGRTGTVLAALASVMMPDEKDSIRWVRENYCNKAVETHAQVEFLREHYGVLPAVPTCVTRKVTSSRQHSQWHKQDRPILPLNLRTKIHRSEGTYVHLPRSPSSVWSENVKLTNAPETGTIDAL